MNGERQYPAHPTVLLTGAAGFVGSNLAIRLLADGYTVIGADNFVSGRPQNLRAVAEHPRFTFLRQDVSSPFTVERPVAWVLHFASLASPPRYLARPIETMRVNAEGTYHLLELARQHGACFLLASTSEVYGDPAIHPQPEGYWGNVNPIGPRSVYDEAKRYAEAMTTAYGRTYDLPVRIARIFNTYGPHMDPEDGRVVTNFIVQALRGEPLTIYGDGSQTRSFQYIDDLVDGIRRLMAVDYRAPVNLGNPEEYSMLEFAAAVQAVLGRDLPLTHHPLPADDPGQRKPDIAVARRVLGWEPRVRLRDGLSRTAAYLRDEVGDGAVGATPASHVGGRP